MKRTITIATVAVWLTAFGGQAQAHSLPQYNWKKMTLEQVVKAQKHLIVLDWKTITTWRESRWVKIDKTISYMPVARLVEDQPADIIWHEKHMAWTQREYRKNLRILAKREAAAKAAARASENQLPWAFWNCVASGWTGGAPGLGRQVSHGEGGATSYNPAGPYYGRYQADATFISSHGKDQIRKYGNSDPRTWSVLDQTIMAEKGYQAQGAGAWPNTAPPCVYLRGGAA